MRWRIEYYSERVQQDILALPSGLQARYIHLTQRVGEFGPDLGMPHSRAMAAGLFELRLKGPEGLARVFFVTLVGRRVVILHSFQKKTAKTPARELAVARRRAREVRDAQS